MPSCPPICISYSDRTQLAESQIRTYCNNRADSTVQPSMQQGSTHSLHNVITRPDRNNDPRYGKQSTKQMRIPKTFQPLSPVTTNDEHHHPTFFFLSFLRCPAASRREREPHIHPSNSPRPEKEASCLPTVDRRAHSPGFTRPRLPGPTSPVPVPVPPRGPLPSPI